jgi:hypothetical protein
MVSSRCRQTRWSDPPRLARSSARIGTLPGTPSCRAASPSILYPPIEQARREYVFQSISGWQENWVVVGAETGTEVTIDGAPPAGCSVHAAGVIDAVQYEARRCPLSAGVHRLSDNGPFQIMAYGYADADAHSFPGGANIKKIYEPPPLF